MQCPQCHAPLPEGANFCSSCGYRFPHAPGVPAAVAPQVVYQKTLRDPNTAMIIEIIGTVLGFMGLGWLYAGRTGTGLLLLFGYWAALVVVVLLSVLTGGIFACIWLPIDIVIAVISGSMAKSALEKDNAAIMRGQ